MDAERVIEIALRYDDTDLEAFALAFRGLAWVALGRIDEGMNALDEAMAIATGSEVTGFTTMSEICVTLSACDLRATWDAPAIWCRAAADPRACIIASSFRLIAARLTAG